MDGDKLNIEKLLRADFNNKTMNDDNHPGHQHSLVNCDGTINFFNLRVLGFLLCKGQYNYKAKSLYQLLWDREDALEKKPVMSWSHLRLQPWVAKCFFYVNLYPVILQEEYAADLDKNAYKKKTGGVQSENRDDTWDPDCPYNDPTKFTNAIDHIFDERFLETMFGPNNTISRGEFLASFETSGMFSAKVDLKWIFNLTQVRKIYQQSIDKGLGDIELENNEIKQIQE